jgi:hypothetical protein
MEIYPGHLLPDPDQLPGYTCLEVDIPGDFRLLTPDQVRDKKITA